MLEEVLQSNKLCILGKITAGIFHEIRNPLSVVKLNLDYLKLVKDDIPEDVSDSIYSAYEALERIEQLINSVMIFSRKGYKDDDHCSIHDITTKACEILISTARKDGITLINKINNGIPVVKFERNKFLQVILNLLTNSVEACFSGGTIELSADYSAGNDLIIKVSDTGCGISDENKSRIFQDFFTNKKDGTGIGLSVCKGILDEYNCSLNFDSTIGVGTAFYITINKALLKENG